MQHTIKISLEALEVICPAPRFVSEHFKALSNILGPPGNIWTLKRQVVVLQTKTLSHRTL